MSQSSSNSSENSGCLGCLGMLFFLVFVASPFLWGMFYVISGKADVSIQNCSLIFRSGFSISCEPQFTPNNLENKVQVVEAAITKFHTHLEQAQCQDIYSEATEGFRKNNQQTDFLAHCQQFSQQLGTLKSVELGQWSWRIINQNSEQIRVYSKAIFSKSSIGEVFAWELKNNKLLLNYCDVATLKKNRTGVIFKIEFITKREGEAADGCFSFPFK